MGKTKGERIRDAREAKKMSQEELGRACRTTKQTIYKYESGIITNIPLDKLEIIADVLGVSSAYLAGWDKSPSHTPDVPASELIDEATPTTKVVQFSNRSEKAPSLSDEALEIARGYEELDHWGKVAVRGLLDTERQRVEDDKQFQLETLLETVPKVINLYTEPSAAGIATPTAGVDFQPYELKPGDPQDAAYAVYIQGDSMEPAFPDGSVVFINHDAIRNGDIGIFCVNGGTVCKQYYRDPMGGIVNLFSLNRKRADADVTIYPGSNETLICQGRVITKKKFPLPEGHM